MKPRLSAVLICACLGAGPAAAHAPSPANDEANSRLPKVELTPQLLHQFLVAEFAGHRGQISLAVGAYRDMVTATRDPRIAKRAAEIALFARQYDAALEAARVWSEADPESQPARQMLASLLAATGRTDELSGQLGKLLAGAGKNVGETLLQLNRILARNPDKAAVFRLVDKLTAPYLGVAEAHYVRAVAAFEAKDPVVARHEADRALALRPDWEQAALLRAQATPRGAEMLSELKAFVGANPEAGEARLAYARALVGDKQFEEARREFTAILASHPDNADIIYAVAVLSLQLNDPGLAETHLKRLVDMRYSEADSARLYLGQIAEERKRPDEALQWYGQIGAGEQYLAAQLRMANVLAHNGRLEEARARLQKANARNPRERAQLILGEAQLLREAGRVADAFGVLETGMKSQPDQPELLYETALAAEKIGRLDLLERHLRRLIELQPDHAHAYNALGYSLADRGERLDEAQRLIDKALELAPEDPFILDSKGWLLYRKGELRAALELLEKALGLRPDPEIAAHFGEVLWTLGRREEAEKAWTEAAKASPTNEALAATIKRFKP